MMLWFKYFRICELCDFDEVEDEIHFLTKCSLYETSRKSLYDKAAEIYPDFTHYDNDVKLLILMNDEDLTKYVADYLYDSYMKRNEILYKNM